jgi:uncharacterized protein (DUF1778 family)
MKRSRIILDVPPDVRRRVKIAAAIKDSTIRDYILEAIEKKLNDEPVESEFLALNDRADPVLGKLWNNPSDARYDEL